MLEILYRIYKVPSDEKKAAKRKHMDEFCGWSSTSQMENEELLMDVCICDTRDQFKDIMRSQYGKDLKFAASKKYPEGTLYCIIIAEHCYDTERYFNKYTYECAECGCKVETYWKNPIMVNIWERDRDLFGIHDYDDYKFCCKECKANFLTKVKKKLRPEDDADNFWIDQHSFHKEGIIGYIYRITKKSTGEFYIGQTKYIPIFRWGQHLKTDRFDSENLTDYLFETIEIIREGDNILDKEKYWIQEEYKKCPEKSLNISCTKNIKPDDLSIPLWD